MADNTFNNFDIMSNSIADQKLTAANTLTVKAWNDIITILKNQANINAAYLNSLNKWLIGDNPVSIPGENSFVEYVTNFINNVPSIGYYASYDVNNDYELPTTKAVDKIVNELGNKTVKFILKDATSIVSGADLNISKYMQVGVYYGDNRSENLINCPTKSQFRMEVYDLVGNNTKNPETDTWVYRVRIITDVDGHQWIQGPHSANIVGVFLNTFWNSYRGDAVVNLGRYTDNDFIEGIKHFAQDVEKVHMSKYPYVEGDNSTLHTVCYTAAIKYVTVYTFYSGDQFSFLKIFTNNPAHSEYTVQLQWNDSTNQYDAIVVDNTSYSKTEVDDKLNKINEKYVALNKTLNDKVNRQTLDDYYMELESMIEESRNEIEDRENLVSIIGAATETLAGVMSANDKKNLNTLVALLQDDENNIVDTIKEVLAIFEQYPEGANLVELLGGKVDKIDVYTKPEIDNLLAGKVDKTTYNTKVEELEENISDLEENISDLDNIKIEIDSLTAKNNIKNYQEILWLGSDEIPEIPTQLPFGSSTDLITFLEGLKNLWSDIDSNLIEQYGYNRVVFLGLYGGKLVKVDIVKASSGNYNTRVHSSIYKANVKECISLNTNKRYSLLRDNSSSYVNSLAYYLTEISGYSKTEIDSKLGDIDAILDAINGEVV